MKEYVTSVSKRFCDLHGSQSDCGRLRLLRLFLITSSSHAVVNESPISWTEMSDTCRVIYLGLSRTPPAAL
ncbi:hypothetical protein AV530_013649 [Patagioenas fasciata monilis]|uniref:Uncharacterized protein n=1 Tax=Patagioenas fasciata monilis TaxID=372326 RepID=A0A1V4J7I2_PATFA|nr:hypothetical protein AV530_013649 [Patagioenas fasciata monilis]